MISPVSSKGPMQFAGGGAGGGGGDPKNWATDCHINGARDWDHFSEEQKKNARDIYAVGCCLGMTPDEMKLALMAGLLESRMYNIGDQMMPGSEEKADPRGGKKCMGHTDPNDHEKGGGVFQQHPFPDGSWGTPGEIMDPVQAATMFYMGRCVPGQYLPSGKPAMADGIVTYTRNHQLRIDPAAPSIFLYTPDLTSINPKTGKPYNHVDENGDIRDENNKLVRDSNIKKRNGTMPSGVGIPPLGYSPSNSASFYI